MSSQLQTIDAADHGAIASALNADGGVIAANYLRTDALKATRKTMQRAIEPVPWCNTYDAYEDNFFGLKTKRLHGVLDYGRCIEDCLLHPLPRELAKQRLSGDVIMSTGELMAIGPGESQQRLHRDGVSWQRANIPFDFLLSVNIALTDFSKENGATVVLPGSHLWPADRQASDTDFVYAEMPAGSALIYTGRTLHSGGQNTTKETRIGLYFGYIPAWLRPLENPVQTHRADTLAALQPESRALLGLSDEGFVAYL